MKAGVVVLIADAVVAADEAGVGGDAVGFQLSSSTVTRDVRLSA